MNELPENPLTSARTHPRGHSTSSVSVIDLRSDTLTKPTPRMREAMKNAVLGDDVYGEDPTVNKLQEACADILGKEASLLVPSCTMANMAAVIVHTGGDFSEILMGDESHMFLYELTGIEKKSLVKRTTAAISRPIFAGIQGRSVTTLPDGTLDLGDMESKIRPLDDVRQPRTKLICLENTHNNCGGRVLSLDYIHKVKEVAKKHNISLHLDGARLFNASTALNVPPSDISQPFDTVSITFSKGLCCPVGSVLAGSREFIAQARLARKALGGSMPQAGVVAAPMLVALDEMIDRLSHDHVRAARIARGLSAMGDNPVCSIAMEGVQSNIVMIETKGKVGPEEFAQRMREVSEREKKQLGECISVLGIPFSATTVRYVLYHGVSDGDVDRVVRKIHYVTRQLSHTHSTTGHTTNGQFEGRYTTFIHQLSHTHSTPEHTTTTNGHF